MTLARVFSAFLGLLLLSVLACGPAPGVSNGDKCDLSNYPARCTDDVLIECVPASDCIHHDCSGLGCECYDYPHLQRSECAHFGQRCVVSGSKASCE